MSGVKWKTGDFRSEGVRVIHTGGQGGQNGVAILLNTDFAKKRVCII